MHDVSASLGKSREEVSSTAVLACSWDLSLLTFSPNVRLGSLRCPLQLHSCTALPPHHCPVMSHFLPSFPQVEALLDEGVYDMRVYKERGFVTDLLYECELEELLKQRTETEEGKELRKVRGGWGLLVQVGCGIIRCRETFGAGWVEG